jgi:hypothetical protein
MAVTQLADIYQPLPFEAAVDNAATERNAFISSGILVEHPEITAMASVGGKTGELPYFNPLSTASEPDYTNDNPASTATPDKIDTGKMIYRLASMHKSWSTMDLARELALRDPLGAIAARVGHWWAVQIQKRIIQSCIGLLADNTTNDSSDMLKNVANDLAAATTDAERISPDVILDAAQTMGDAKELLNAIAMHSVVYTKLQKQGFINFIQPAKTDISIPMLYGKYTVIVDDGLPAVAGTNRITYTSILFATGAFAHGKGVVMKPSEMERVPNAGNGGGQDIIHTRRADIIHPLGLSFTSSSVAGQSATLAELATAANWDRKWARKNIGLAFLKTNG